MSKFLPPIAQLVERRTVDLSIQQRKTRPIPLTPEHGRECEIVILRSLVRFRLGGISFLFHFQGHEGTSRVVSYVLAKFHIDPSSVEASGGLDGEHRCMPKLLQTNNISWRRVQSSISVLPCYFAPPPLNPSIRANQPPPDIAPTIAFMCGCAR